ncbi:MAG TPA: zf-HC2 domain-containing protein [Pseudonocardiaceae bacterium]
MRDNCAVDCMQWREALSARLDGEDSGVEPGAIDAHLAICAACSGFVDDAARVTRLARMAVVTPAPDVTLKLMFTIDGPATVLQALTDLDRVSTSCAKAMMAHNSADMVNATRAALDCADIAGAAQRILSRPSAPDAGVIRAILEAAVTAADRCAAECGQHAGHHGHCRAHSESAQRAAQLCRSELANITG